MNLALIIIVYLLGIVLIAKEVLDDLYIIQLKEYRFDRLRDFFFSREGRLFLRKRVIIFAFFLTYIGIDFGLSLILSSRNIAPEIEILPLLLFGLFVLIHAYGFIRAVAFRKIIFPLVTLRLSATFFATVFLMLLILFLKSDLIFAHFESGIIFYLATAPLFVLMGMLCTYPLSGYLKKRMFNHAKEKRKRFKNLTVIGITGSYGKTSVKEYLYSVLSTQLKVLKTEEHVNTEIGVAKTVLEKLNSEYDLFIVEMGAYAKGEIKAIAEIVQPYIGIITGINEQHVSLFGSINNIVNAKAELVFSLSKKGFAVLNKDNEYVRRISQKMKKKTYFYSIEDDANIVLKKVQSRVQGTVFIVEVEGRRMTFKTKLIGMHNVQNLLPVILIALKLGVSEDNIRRAVQELSSPRDNMEIITKGAITIINNTYNLNPASINAYLDIAKNYMEKSKILILDDILELGKDSIRIHREIAKKLIGNVDVLILVGKNHSHVVKKALIGTPLKKVFVTRDASEIKKIVAVEHEPIVAFLGRGTRTILNQMYE